MPHADAIYKVLLPFYRKKMVPTDLNFCVINHVRMEFDKSIHEYLYATCIHVILSS